MSVLQPVILSGGVGTGLWLLSREMYLKQFLPLTGETIMLQQTIGCADTLPGADVRSPLVVCNEDHRPQ